MAELIGTVTSIRVAVSRKMSDDAYGSYSVDAGVEIAVPVGASPDDVLNTWDAYLTSWVGVSMKEKGELVAKSKPVAQVVQQHQQRPSNDGEGRFGNEVEHPRPAPVEETRVSVDDDGKEYKTIEVDHFEITVGSDNIRTCKVFGKPYVKFGVRCWPEPLEGVGIKLDILEAGKFMLPPGYTKAKVLMVDDKPKKVWKFEK